MSGAPLNITTNGSVAESTAFATSFRNCINRPDLVSAVTLPAHGQPVVQHQFLRGTGVGNLGQPCTPTISVVRDVDNWNMSLFKTFVISESVEASSSSVQMRSTSGTTRSSVVTSADGGISTSLGASNFGQVTAAYDPRMLQLGAKVCSKFSVLIGSLCFTFPCSHLPVRTGFLFSNQRKRLALRLSQKTLGC